MLYELMDFAHRRYYMVAGYQCVDDLVQRCDRSITTCLPEAAEHIPRGCSDLGLVVSAGNTMIAGHLAAAKTVAAELRAMEYVIGFHKEVRDWASVAHSGDSALQECRPKG